MTVYGLVAGWVLTITHQNPASADRGLGIDGAVPTQSDPPRRAKPVALDRRPQVDSLVLLKTWKGEVWRGRSMTVSVSNSYPCIPGRQLAL